MQEILFLRDLGLVLTCAMASGWLLQRLGFSAVVGYILGGIIIGPFSPAVKLVSDLDHVQFLAQIGLVFLMFSVGLGLSFARLQRMGLSVVVAVIVSALLLFNVCRLFGAAMGWNSFQTFFIAGTLMISSSAIIIKVLDNLNIAHQRAGQLALGITVLEDIVAVVMLTLFLSLIKLGGGEESSIWSTLGSLAVFVSFLVVTAMLLLPRLLQALNREASPELRILAVTGLLLLAAVWAVESGYSVALGAFVLGVVVAGTRHKDEVERSFEALHHIFGSVFFVAVGMMFDFRLLADVWGLVIVITAITVVVRPMACAIGLVVAGHTPRNGLKAGIALTPIGEFAFVMIQVGRSANVLPETFYALAIGVSLTTAAIGPVLTRRSEAICSWVEKHEPRRWRDLVRFYQGMLARLHGRTNRSLLWRLTSRKIMQLIFQVLFVSALIVFSKPLLRLMLDQFGDHLFFDHGTTFFFWLAFSLLVLGPCIVIWRDMEAIVLILADGAVRGRSGRGTIRSLLQIALRTVGALVLFGWFFLLAPPGSWLFWILLTTAAGTLVFLPFVWKRMVRFHSRLEQDFRERVRAASTLGATSGLPVSVLERPQDWNLQIDEVVLPSATDHAGKTIGEIGLRNRFGCSIMAIDRQGFLIANPGAGERLFSGDKLLILGAGDKLPEAEQYLRGVSATVRSDEFNDMTMDSVDVPSAYGGLNATLSELNLVSRFGLQICGIQREGRRILVPASSERLVAGDRLLVLGTVPNIQQFREHIGLNAGDGTPDPVER